MANPSAPHAHYRRLFVHRDDVFAEQQANGAYLPVRRPLTDDDIADHLAGNKSYGVYVIDPGTPSSERRVLPMGVTAKEFGYRMANSVRYVVFDLDTYDAAALDFLERAVERLVFTADDSQTSHPPLRCLLLEDSGRKGYHIWLLLSEPVPAAKARAWAETVRAGYEAAGALVDDVVNPGRRWPALEIFPKQDAVSGDGFGNLVKLPRGRHAVTHAWSMFKTRAGWAAWESDVVPFPASLIPEAPLKAESSTRSEAFGRTEFACVNELLESGATQGCRDDAMYWLAKFWRTSGLTVEQCEAVCIDANEVFDPPLGELQVRKCVRSAYAAEYARPKCGEPWHSSLCPGSERMRACPNYRGPALGPSMPYADEVDFDESLEDMAKRLRGES